MAWLDVHVADGLDLGVGMIALATRNEEERGVMMASLQSMWQDNQTWLVVLGGIFYGIPIDGQTFTGTVWGWFHPYSLLFTLGVIMERSSPISNDGDFRLHLVLSAPLP